MNCLIIRSYHVNDCALAWAQVCAADIIETLEERNILYLDLLYKEATLQNVKSFLLSRENHPTVIFGFGHGNPEVFTGHNKEILLSCSPKDTELFVENFFYLHSCSCGQELGKKIVDCGGKGFLGYNETYLFVPQNVLACVRAANKGILEMIRNDRTLNEAYEMTLAAYDEEMKKAIRTGKQWVYSTLKWNKAKFVKHGSDDFVMSSIFNGN
jgi:hypothetical protein